MSREAASPLARCEKSTAILLFFRVTPAFGRDLDLSAAVRGLTARIVLFGFFGFIATIHSLIVVMG